MMMMMMMINSGIDNVYDCVDDDGGNSDWILENLESHGILFFSFPGLESNGILCRVMESHGKLNHY